MKTVAQEGLSLVEKKPKPMPQFKRVSGVRSEEIGDLLSALAADGYPEWLISQERTESWEYHAKRKVGGPNGTVTSVKVTESFPVTFTVMGYWEMEMDDEDEEA